MDEATVKELKWFRTAAIDARKGYLEALSEASKPEDLTRLFKDMAQPHMRHANELNQELPPRDRDMEDGSIMGYIHKTIMDVRGLVGGLDQSVIPGLIDGEKRNISHYEKSAEKVSGQAHILALLDRHKGDLMKVVQEMKKKRPK